MDAEEDVGLVYTYYHHLDQRTGTLTPASCDELEGYVYPRVLAGKTTIRYVTVMMRRDHMLSAPYLGKRIVYDTFWFYQCSRLHRVRLLREYTAVYRHLDTSASHYKRDDRMARINYFYVINSARRYFCEHYPCEDDTLRRRQLKKATVHCFKYALAHRDCAICLDLHIPFFPLYSLKKTLYCILHKCCKSPKIFNALCNIYARHISK